MAQTKIGTPYYISPELLNGSYSYKTDVWGIGCILYEICTFQKPFYSE